MSNTEARIIIKTPTFGSRAITKVAAYPDGGFAVVMPYHAAQRGWLAKVPVDYKRNDLAIARAETVEYDVNSKVKLSYHADGFVQFSGETAGRVISGRDQTTGEIKGLGLVTSPIAKPISSGPTFAVLAWGIGEFKEAPQPRTSDIIFEEDDLYYRGCTPDTANAYLVEAFVLPPPILGRRSETVRAIPDEDVVPWLRSRARGDRVAGVSADWSGTISCALHESRTGIIFGTVRILIKWTGISSP